MTYREKIAWVSLAAMAVTFGPYFAIVESGLMVPEPLPNLRMMGLFAACMVAQAIIVGIGYLVLSREPDARIPPDERDNAIARRATTFAYYVMMFGLVLVGVVMPFTSSGWKLVNSALIMFVVAELVRYSTIVASYRGQS